MNLAEIDSLGWQLYRSPDVRVPMRDALEDLGLTWSDWLEQFALRRLAETMVVDVGGLHAGQDLLAWWARLGWDGGAPRNAYPSLCSAFHVPEVRIQVEEPQLRLALSGGIPWQRARDGWLPPTAELAMETLRLALAGGELRGRAELADAVRRRHPRAVRYQVRLRNEPWQQIPLL